MNFEQLGKNINSFLSSQKILDNLNDFSEEESCIIARVYGYEKFISDLNQQNKIKEKKKEKN